MITQISMGDLLRMLTMYDVPLDLWGADGNKTVEELHEEMLNRESRVVPSNGKIRRFAQSARGDIFHEAREDGERWKKGQLLRLHEDFHLVRNVRGKPWTFRELKRPASVSGTWIDGEFPETTLCREVGEETGVKITPDRLIPVDAQHTLKGELSSVYPGIESVTISQTFMIEFDHDEFAEKGYVHRNGRAIVIHRWHAE
jgi:hypothetical protein